MSRLLTGTVTATAPAKINLCLGVGSRREDGFHALATVYQAVGLHDRVTVSAADDVSVTVRTERLPVDGVPTDGSNIAVRAALLLARHHGSERGVAITVDKGIPVAGGLAGGSADAAAALLACDRLWGLGTPRGELLELAGELGSDVPFALVGGTAVGSGRGELVTPLAVRGEFWWVVLESTEGLSTPAVYSEFDLLCDASVPEVPTVSARVLDALAAEDVAALGAALSNDLQAAALRLRPELHASLAPDGLGRVHGTVVSGSGPSCLFLCGSRADAAGVAEALRARGLGAVSLAPGPAPGASVLTSWDGH